MKKAYYPELDVIKGIAILLIILGHSLCEFPVNIGEQLSAVIPYVDGFSLAIFFVASGFLFSTKDSWGVFLKKKNARLLIPYATFCFLTILLRFAFAPFTHSGAPSVSDAFIRLLTGGYYWFLYALFFIMAICRAIRNIYALIIVALICIVISILDLKAHRIIMRCINFFPFFVAGFILKQNYEKVTKYLSGTISLSMIVALPIVYVVIVATTSSFHGLTFVLEGIIGSIFIWLASIELVKTGLLVNPISYFGHFSLQFYLNHLLIMLPCYYIASFLPFSNATVLWLVIFMLAIAISWIMLLLEKRIKWLYPLCGL
ncbi:MAG: acyltransferase family protein [Bacteroides sp.]|nr:acyltransferase family protein [Bacteroides sp.]MCM1446695.1 acyltransferase family protein [Bacteroides sp.]